jgi:hypothetical protein
LIKLASKNLIALAPRDLAVAANQRMTVIQKKTVTGLAQKKSRRKKNFVKKISSGRRF